MPPRTRSCKTTKGLKENIGLAQRNNFKAGGKPSKSTRKVLADKTNSASDENISGIDVPKKAFRKGIVSSKDTKVVNKDEDRPRRERRLPNRYVENQVLKNLSNNKENTSLTLASSSCTLDASKTNESVKITAESPLKTPDKSLVTSRPRRVCRLPTRFADQSISPNKHMHMQPPFHASTPIVQNSAKDPKSQYKDDKIENVQNIKPQAKTSARKKGNVVEKINEISPDTNNNAKQGRRLRPRKIDAKNLAELSKDSFNVSTNNTVPRTSKTPRTAPERPINAKSDNKIATQKPLGKNLSFRVLEDKNSQKDDNLDIYEFTYDPTEEPAPQKKKRKRIVKKKPKTFNFISNYDQNLSKAMAALKNVVSKKPSQSQNIVKPQDTGFANTISADIATTKSSTNSIIKSNDNHTSVHVEDIAADFQAPVDHHDIDYSPVNSPTRPKTPVASQSIPEIHIDHPAVPDNDPLKLRDTISFFDDEPVASSSMNMSARHPHASPWRVEFNRLPIKWQVSSYVKPNMTPAVECSFINFDDSKKKHVYTDMVPQRNESLPQLVSETLKQTSIMSFIKEVVEKSASKKKRGRSVSPTKFTAVFDDVTATSVNKNTTPGKLVTTRKSIEKHVTSTNENNDQVNSRELRKRKNDNDTDKILTKDKDNTFFGFDDSEDLENISPKTNDGRRRALRPRSRAVLKEINAQAGPTRANLPVSVKSKTLNSEAVTKMYEEMKPAAEAIVCPENPVEAVEVTNEVSTLEEENDVDSQSVHLFEDIEVVHHLKPSRKSYGKAKKVAFQRNSLSDSETQDSEIVRPHQDDEDSFSDLNDLTFEAPALQQKKTKKKKLTKKQKISNKEKKEADEWAAGFNSMCEDIDEFDLIVE